MALPKGSGLWIWRTDLCNPKAVIDDAVAMGQSHVIFKVADGRQPYQTGGSSYLPNAEALTKLAHERGLQAYAWAFLYGISTSGEGAYQGALAARLGIDGFVIDCEPEDGSQPYADSSQAARNYMNAYRAAAPLLTTGFSSYWKPSSHSSTPYAAFLERCDFVAPQTYWRMGGVGDPAAMLRRSVQELKSYGKPIVPTGGDFSESGRVQPSEMRAFVAACKDLGISSWNWWCLDQIDTTQRQTLKEFSKPMPTNAPSLPRVAEIAEQVVAQGRQKKTVTVNGVPFNTAEKGYCGRFVRLCLTAALREKDPSWQFGAESMVGYWDPPSGEFRAWPWMRNYASDSSKALQAGGTSELLGHYGTISQPARGDVVCFTPYTQPGHIAVFLGGGRIAENTSSPDRGPGTVISSLEHPTLQGRARFFRVLPQVVARQDLMLVGLDGQALECGLKVQDDVATADLEPLVRELELQLQISFALGGYGQVLTSACTKVTARVKVRQLLEACGLTVTYVKHPDGRERLYLKRKDQVLEIPAVDDPA